MWTYGLDRAGLGQGQVTGICECSNEPSGSIKCEEFLDWLKTGQLFKKDSAPWSSAVRTQNAGCCIEEYSFIVAVLLTLCVQSAEFV